MSASPHSAKFHFYFVYAGSLPFIILTALLVFEVEFVPYLGQTVNILATYGLIISVFLAGVHWGQYLAGIGGSAIYLPIISNIIVVFVWVAYLSMPIYGYLISLVFIFILLLIIDFKLAKTEQISQSYFRLRLRITTIVLISLVISAFT
jgi:hypothetical protein